ncbi:glycosyltransferase sypQ [Vibrio ishigakensis]|uniref:Glycosyltransferase sypQ n=1 Tax=Vibrio ishigakensis TaxID=1481914 RepID=A0A0B8PA18_9VIBR|nr:glycosyltransferase sypQ [Vibrio ishigakensis]
MLTPYLMLICLGTSLALYEVTLFQWLFWGQVSVYLTGILGVAAPVVLKFKPLQLIHYLLSGHTANLIGGLSYLARKH